MGRTKPLRDSISVTVLEDQIFEWVKERYEASHARSMTDRVLEVADAAIRPYEVWIPLATSVVEEPVRIGRVLLKTFPREFFDEWRNRTAAGMRTASTDEQAKALTSIDGRRTLLQGLTLAVAEVTAEPIRAKELALVYTEEALAGMGPRRPIPNHLVQAD
jgi:hypothetical protein